MPLPFPLRGAEPDWAEFPPTTVVEVEELAGAQARWPMATPIPVVASMPVASTAGIIRRRERGFGVSGALSGSEKDHSVAGSCPDG